MNELLSQDSLTSKRNFKVGKDVLNLHEKLTALSNRRLTNQSLSFFNLNWSIDRITIVGFLKKFDFDRTFITEDGEIIYTAGEDFTMAQAMPLLAREEGAQKVGAGWALLDKYGENIAYVEVLPFLDKATGREKRADRFQPE